MFSRKNVRHCSDENKLVRYSILVQTEGRERVKENFQRIKISAVLWQDQGSCLSLMIVSSRSSSICLFFVYSPFVSRESRWKKNISSHLQSHINVIQTIISVYTWSYYVRNFNTYMYVYIHAKRSTQIFNFCWSSRCIENKSLILLLK